MVDVFSPVPVSSWREAPVRGRYAELSQRVDALCCTFGMVCRSVAWCRVVGWPIARPYAGAVHSVLCFALMRRVVLCCAMLCCITLGCAVLWRRRLVEVSTMLAHVESSCTDLTGIAHTAAPALVHPTSPAPPSHRCGRALAMKAPLKL